MLTDNRVRVLATGSASTMSSGDWYRLFGSTAGTNDNLVYLLSAPELQAEVYQPEKRDKEYWKPNFDRFKKYR